MNQKLNQLKHGKFIMDTLAEIGFHPDMIGDRKSDWEKELEKSMEFSKDLKDPSDIQKLLQKKPEMGRYFNAEWDFTMLKTQYLPIVIFLDKLFGYIDFKLQDLNKVPAVADDMVRTGLSLYCTRKKYGDKISLVGIHPNEALSVIAKERCPDVRIMENLGEEKFDIIYANLMPEVDDLEIEKRAIWWSSCLNHEGLVVQQIDFGVDLGDVENDFYMQSVSQHLPLQKKDYMMKASDCNNYLVVFKKK